jgi:5'-3' exonuclease
VDPAEVEKRYGIRPDQVPDFIALRGDPSDGIPGAKGIGEKSARDLLQKHGTLEAVLNAAEDKTKGSAAVRALTSQADLLRTFADVATVRDIDVKRPPDTPLDKKGAADAARAHGLTRLATRLTP